MLYCSFYKCSQAIPEGERSEVDQWINENNLEAFRAFFEKKGNDSYCYLISR